MLTTEVWNPIAAETIAAIRAVDPTRDLIVEAGEYADAKELRDGLVLPAGDPHLIGSFHLYAPMLFTHQGTDNAGGEYATVGVLFPGPPATPIAPTAAALEKKWVADWFTKYNAEPVATNPSSEPVVADPVRKAFTWAEKTKLRVYVGEFGVNEAADEASRVRWLTFARKEMERRGFGWAVWNMFGGFGLYDPKTKAWNQKLKAALLP
jgi:endoglucanase